MTDLSGQYLGRYYLSERLGEGGMAVVYRAYDTRLERDVAIKIIRSGAFPADALGEVLKRFEREAKSLAKLSHPNIVKVYDYGEHEGSPYLVMEYLSGGTLKRILGEPVPWQDAVQLILPVARGVAYAHQRGVLHRDIKPANVLITDGGEPMLSDFGIAKLFEGEQTTALTGSGMAIGTPEYMAPEQWTGTTSPQSDLYSLGIVLYEMLTGRKPYVADTPAAILIKQATEPLPNPRKFAADLPETLELVMIKALAKEPEDRHKDMDAFVDALENLQASTGVVAPPAQKTADSTESPKIGEVLPPSASSARIHFPVRFSRRMIITFIGIVTVAAVAWVLNPNVFSAFVSVATATPTPTRLSSTPTFMPPSFTSSPSPTLTNTVIPTTPLPIEIIDVKGVQMVLVSSGSFLMGNNQGYPHEKPVHEVYVDSFYIDKYEVTNKLYKACVDVGVCDAPANFRSRSRDTYFGNPLFEDFPVISVNWNMAKKYCEWRNVQLPSEAQWERASEGSVAKADYGQGTAGCFMVDVSGCVGDTYSVGSNMAGNSDYDVYNMRGNVWEWVEDWYDPDYYNSSPVQNPLGPTQGQNKVTRGRGWIVDPGPIFITYGRMYTSPLSTYMYIGFRCAMDATQ